MLHFVLKDVNPEKIGDFKNFLKEMNDTVVLLTVANGPFVSANDLEDSGTEGFQLSRSENDFDIVFKGEMAENKVAAGEFVLSFKGKKLMVTSYTVQEDAASDMRVQLNVEGEVLARKELETAFKRDFSQEAHEYIKSPLEALRRKLEREKPVERNDQIDSEESEVEANELPAELEPAAIENETTEEPVIEQVEPENEETQELFLTPRTQDLINDPRALIPILSDLCHDMTRGATINFSTYELREEALENGAHIQMLDNDQKDHIITLRIGALNNLTEISYFLETIDNLIFSIYLSSEGKGNVKAPAGRGHIAFKKVKEYLT
jgi:hypothetical protein